MNVGSLVVSNPTSTWEVQEAAPGAITAPSASRPSASKRFSLFKDFNIQGAGSFHDLLGEVVKIYHDTPHDIVEIYITDYTEHANLHEHVAEPSWLGPVGRRTLRVDLFPPHSAFTRLNVGPGSFVYLTNVRVKWSPTGELEGSIFQDKKYPDKVCVSVCTYGPQLEELQARKTSLHDTPHMGPQKGKSAAKKARQRANKKEREQQEQQGGRHEGSKETPASNNTEEEAMMSKLMVEPKLNPNGMSQLPPTQSKHAG